METVQFTNKYIYVHGMNTEDGLVIRKAFRSIQNRTCALLSKSSKCSIYHTAQRALVCIKLRPTRLEYTVHFQRLHTWYWCIFWNPWQSIVGELRPV